MGSFDTINELCQYLKNLHNLVIGYFPNDKVQCYAQITDLFKFQDQLMKLYN